MAIWYFFDRQSPVTTPFLICSDTDTSRLGRPDLPRQRKSSSQEPKGRTKRREQAQDNRLDSTDRVLGNVEAGGEPLRLRGTLHRGQFGLRLHQGSANGFHLRSLGEFCGGELRLEPGHLAVEPGDLLPGLRREAP